MEKKEDKKNCPCLLLRWVPESTGMKVVLLICVITAVGAIISLLNPGGFVKSSDLLRTGKYYYDKGDYDRAVEFISRAIEADPSEPRAYMARALAYSGMRQLDLALADMDRAISMKPDSEYACYLRGTIYAGKGQLDLAIEDFDRAVRLNGVYSLAYTGRGLARSHKGEHERGLQDCNQAISLDRKSLLARWGRGIVLLRMRSFKEASYDFIACISIKPENAFHHVNLYLAESHLPEDAKFRLAEFRKTLKDDHKWPAPVIRMFLGEITPDELITEASHVEKRKEIMRFCEAYFYTGQFYLLKGEEQKARSCFKKCVDTGVSEYSEYYSAKAELAELEK